MKLPTQKTQPKKQLNQTNITIFSPPKAGKSTLASHIPDAIFFSCEEGQNFLKVHKITIKNWNDFLGACRLLVTQEHKFKMIVVDTIDRAVQMCEEYICKQEGVKKLSEIAMGAGFGMVRKELVRVVNRVNQEGLGLMFLSHCKLVSHKSKTSEITVMETSLSASIQKEILGLSDFILYGYVDSNGKRWLRTKPTRNILAGDRTGRMPELIEFSYDALLEAFNNAVTTTKENKNAN